MPTSLIVAPSDKGRDCQRLGQKRLAIIQLNHFGICKMPGLTESTPPQGPRFMLSWRPTRGYSLSLPSQRPVLLAQPSQRSVKMLRLEVGPQRV